MSEHEKDIINRMQITQLLAMFGKKEELESMDNATHYFQSLDFYYSNLKLRKTSLITSNNNEVNLLSSLDPQLESKLERVVIESKKRATKPESFL